MKKNVVEAKLRVYKKHMACAEKEVIWYRDEIARLEALLQERNLTLPAPDKGDSPAPRNLSTLDGDSTAEHEPAPAPCG
jgi:hypothetical protein